ncbi:MAG: prepilin peptidase, partial [Deltaproteobacteria bacterium]|nr:prepilin peptidase [Deltaproteobacteria bacterium]
MLYYFLPAILALGIITSYEDIRYGKIRNGWVIFALVYAIIIYSALIINAYFIGKVNTPYLIELMANIGFAVIAGFSMWYFGLWTAGDVKLFIAYSAIIHLSV